MNVEIREVVLNLLAGLSPLVDPLRRLRDRNRPHDYARQVRATLDRLRVRRAFLGDERIRGAALLEVGSGREFGLALLLLALDARRVVNVEIEPYRFIDDAAFYRALVEAAAAEGLSIGWPPRGLLPRGAAAVAPDTALVTLYLGRSAAAIPEPDGSIDVSFSVAVLEHVRLSDMPAVARELARLTRPGGTGIHRVDFVDHYHRHDDPFRFLRLSHREYEWMYSNRYSYSNRLRMDDFERIFRAAGFAEARFENVTRHEDVAEFERWRCGFHPSLRDRDPDMLRARSAMLVLRR
jgi:SAM-dependent methyltransferase